ncbi:hypothetical protein JDV02_009259 [Purpureocillium takamizusanense]|uniref:Uncharacterized protein n=1 Tax=Purpureocillium takamizusanense TaxID=2060973 RepID=A0A9Q8QQA8_9HYPO|nr:uncharacterized protein JDV02_009259 [Purpureocillium takamizusanense]UNI23442.1 hypothetical protein JDV02_009259 [Purpureocillium takamizusanense]
MAAQNQQSESTELLNALESSAISQNPHVWSEAQQLEHQQQHEHPGMAEDYDSREPHRVPSSVSEWARPAYQPVPDIAGQPMTTQKYDPSSTSSEVPPEPSKEQQPAQHLPEGERYWGGGWGAEIVCVVFSILCVVAIIIILSRVDGQLLSSWTIAVSPNAVVAVLSTAAKAAMILPVTESISQLKWLFLKRRALGPEHLQQFDNASRGPWGALKLLWHARKSPFPTYIGCLVTIAAIAVDPFTQQILSFEQKSTQMPGVHSSTNRSQVYDNGDLGVTGVGAVVGPTRDGLLQAAAIAGVYDLVSPPPFICPGSNCTYPDFTSLGVCSKCSDVTARTTKSCEDNPGGFRVQQCNFTMPGGFKPEAYATSDAHNGFRYTHLNVSVNATQVPPTQLITLGMIRFAMDDGGGNTHWQDTVTAYECGYEVCAKEYSGWRSINGTVRTGTVRESRLNLTGIGPLVPFTTLEKGFPGNTTFEINFLDIQAMTGALMTIFYTKSGSTDSNSFMAGLYNSPDIVRTVDNIATGMSYRMLSGPNTTAVTGEVFAVQTYMRTHWAWLSLTAVLEVLTCLFLIIVIVATNRARQHAWKSSLAPLLYEDATIDK